MKNKSIEILRFLYKLVLHLLRQIIRLLVLKYQLYFCHNTLYGFLYIQYYEMRMYSILCSKSKCHIMQMCIFYTSRHPYTHPCSCRLPCLRIFVEEQGDIPLLGLLRKPALGCFCIVLLEPVFEIVGTLF